MIFGLTPGSDLLRIQYLWKARNILHFENNPLKEERSYSKAPDKDMGKVEGKSLDIPTILNMIVQEIEEIPLSEPLDHAGTRSTAQKQVDDQKKMLDSAAEARKLGVCLEKKDFFLKLFNLGINLFSTSLVIAAFCGATAISFGIATPFLVPALIGSSLRLLESIGDVYCSYCNLRAEQKGETEKKYMMGGSSMANLIYAMSRKIYSKPEEAERCKQLSIHGSIIISALFSSCNCIFAAHSDYTKIIELVQSGVQSLSGVASLGLLIANRSRHEKLTLLQYHADLVKTKKEIQNAASISPGFDVTGITTTLQEKIEKHREEIKKSRCHAAVYNLFAKCSNLSQKSIPFAQIAALSPAVSSGLPCAAFILSAVTIGMLMADTLGASLHLHRVRQCGETKHQEGLPFDGDWLAYGMSKLTFKKASSAVKEEGIERELKESVVPTIASLAVRGFLNLLLSSYPVPTRKQEDQDTRTALSYINESLTAPLYASTFGNLFAYETLISLLNEKKDDVTIIGEVYTEKPHHKK